MIRIKRGLDLPITGALSSASRPGGRCNVAVIGFDYHGMKPTMAVQVGDRVKLGQVLFSDKKRPAWSSPRRVPAPSVPSIAASSACCSRW